MTLSRRSRSVKMPLRRGSIRRTSCGSAARRSVSRFPISAFAFFNFAPDALAASPETTPDSRRRSPRTETFTSFHGASGMSLSAAISGSQLAMSSAICRSFSSGGAPPGPAIPSRTNSIVQLAEPADSVRERRRLVRGMTWPMCSSLAPLVPDVRILTAAAPRASRPTATSVRHGMKSRRLVCTIDSSWFVRNNSRGPTHAELRPWSRRGPARRP